MSTVEGRFRDKDNWIWIRKHKYIKQQPKFKNLSIRGVFFTEHAHYENKFTKLVSVGFN